ncbi:MAG: hypothetical protein AAGC55_08825 [Myxococcota bacterium]
MRPTTANRALIVVERGEHTAMSLALVVLVTLVGGCKDSDLERVDIRGHYGDREIGTLKNGKKHGQWLRLFDGKKNRLDHWQDGVLQGLSQSWYDDGAPLSDRWFENGQYHGRFRVFGTEGKLAELGWMRWHRRDGLWCEWYDDGRIKRIAQYHDDRFKWEELDPERPCPLTQGRGARHRDPADRSYRRSDR